MQSESSVWSGSPSQWTNASKFLVCGVACLTVVLAVVAVPYAIWVWLVTKNTKYDLTTERLQLHSGVLSKKTEDMELYRVRDTKVEQPFLLRLVGLGNITLVSSDSSTPSVSLRGVKDAKSVREQVRDLVEARRDRKRVRVSELE